MPVLLKSNRKINIICPTPRDNSKLKLVNHSESVDLHLTARFSNFAMMKNS